MREVIREVRDQRAHLLRHLGVQKLECGGCSKCYKVKAHFDCGNNLNCALNML